MFATEINKLEIEIAAAHARIALLKDKAVVADQILTRLTEVIGKFNLYYDMENVNVYVTDQGQLRITVDAQPTDKFKFYSWKGYNASGSSCNRKRCCDKATKMEAKFAKYGLHVAVNEFSLEDSHRRKATRVFLSIYEAAEEAC